jgi:3-oxoacyl-[acyl-carrier-protein] synthase II
VSTPSPMPVITGMGAIAPTGCGIDELWQGVMRNRTTFAPIVHFDASRASTDVAGFVTLPGCDAGSPERLLELALVAIRQATAAAGLDDLSDAVLLVGTTDAGAELGGWESGAPPPCNATIAGMLARRMGIGGLATGLGNASASGAAAIALAGDLVEAGEARAVIACGADTITRTAYYGLHSLRVLSPEGSRPFDARRMGIRISEGAGAMVLEESSSALARGAGSTCRLAGWGVSNRASHLLRSSSRGIAEAMLRALDRGGLARDDVAYVNAHGAGTMQGDAEEIEALRDVFGPALPAIPINSSKPVLGHCQGAAGMLETIVTALAVAHRVSPPTYGLDAVDPRWADLDFARGSPAALRPGIGISLSSGLGGINVALALAPPGT